MVEGPYEALQGLSSDLQRDQESIPSESFLELQQDPRRHPKIPGGLSRDQAAPRSAPAPCPSSRPESF
jgi:hypothetical protein